MTRKPAWIFMILLLAGCATTPTGNAAKVRITANPDAVKGCESLGIVRGSSTNVLGSGSENVEKEMKTKASQLGGNVVFVISSETHRYSEGSGEAYRCAQTEP